MSNRYQARLKILLSLDPTSAWRFLFIDHSAVSFYMDGATLKPRMGKVERGQLMITNSGSWG